MKYSDIIEDLYYGNLRLNELSGRLYPNIGKALDELEECETWLTENLTGESKNHLIHLLNCHASLLGETSFENFSLGFRVGMQLMLDICTDDLADIRHRKTP